MSRTSRFIVGFAALVSTIGFAAVGFFGLRRVFLLAILSGVVTASCFVEYGRFLTVRLIGLTIFIVFGWYVVTSWNTPDFYRAIGGMLAFGLPAGYVAIAGFYPRWGEWAAAFRHDELDESAAPPNS